MKKSMLWLTLAVALSLIVLPGCSAMNLLPVQPARASAPVVVAPTPMSAETVPPTKAGTLADLEGTLERIYQDVSPSVVNIQVIQKQTVGMGLPGMLPELPFFGQPLPQPLPQEQYQRGLGSGFVWDKGGHVVTNNHVVERMPRYSPGRSFLTPARDCAILSA